MHAPKFLRTLRRRWKRYIHRYGYNPLRAIARERERRRFIHIGMRFAQRQAPKSVFRVPPPPELPRLMHVARLRTQPLPRVPAFPPRFRPTDMDAMRGATHSGAFASDRADAWVNEPGVDETKRRLRSVRLEAMQ